ncbi:FixH family protein [Nocardia jiangxiensis]|uniref:FixH family protein n=1 Tax=Nocardia jiangxiensis TaxID=282685 RepID=UPI00030ED269|nr:FixH family protein [Nocardia jiangxiensis]
MTTVEPVTHGPRARTLRVGGVLALVIALVALIGWLLWPSPPGHLVMHSGTADYIVTVTLDSPRMGDTGIDIELTDRAGRSVDGAVVRVQAVEPRMGYSDAPVTASASGAGRYRAPDVSFMMTGPWDLRVSIVVGGATDQLSVPLWISG